MLEGLHKIVSDNETIVAISTPLGRSGIGVVRLSGSQGITIAGRFFKGNAGTSSLQHRTAVVGTWNDSVGEPIDEVVLTLFQAPHSYTGEDVIEISAHGNPRTLRRIVDCTCYAGARLATPGEFTLRAVAHGKMDLVQAEAVREFIDAQTDQQARMALRQMEGALSRQLRPTKDEIVNIVARLEAGIDFAEDDVDVPENGLIAQRIRPLCAQLNTLKDSFRYGKILSSGLRVAILGKPNVGKSSLFNCLVSAERAIVTDTPGTTRDVVTETVSLDGVPLCFADTAGLRDTTDEIESIGVTRTLETVAEADLSLVVLDGSCALDDDDRKVLLRADRMAHVVIINKRDLPQRLDLALLNGAKRVLISAKTGEGLDELQAALREFLLSSKTSLHDHLVLTSSRQYEAVAAALDALILTENALKQSIPHEMVLLDLYRALSALGELTGEVVTEDILGRIFSTFCIGK